MNSPKLTIIVKDTHNNLVKDAQVSIIPGNITGKTDKNGQVILALPDQKKVTVQIKLNDVSQEVPYYVSDNQNNRLEVNLAYFQQLQAQKPTKSTSIISSQANHFLFFGILIIIILLILNIFFLIKKNHHQAKFPFLKKLNLIVIKLKNISFKPKKQG
jgi:uncharacterized integral membrane protein